MFVKEGSIIPIGPEIQFTDERPADPLTLLVYAGRDCAFTLYEDEGINYDYEKGECSTIKFSYNNTRNELTIGGRTGEYDGMLKSRKFNIIWVTRNKPVPFDPGMRPQSSVEYTGKEIKIII